MAAIGRVLLIPKGDYSGSTAYNALDWVRYNGMAWVCKVDNTIGVVPTESAPEWQVLAKDGSVSGSVEWNAVANKPFSGVDSSDFDTNGSDNLVIKRDTFGTMRIVSGGTTTNLEASGDSVFQIEAGTNVTIAADDTATPKKITINSTGGTGSANWGSIGGTLSDQTDLNTALGNKASASDVTAIQNVIPSTATTSNKLVTASDISGKADSSDLDDWSTTSQVQSDNTVTFTGLNDAYGYDLFCENKVIGVSAMTKTGSGTSVQLVFTVTGASSGDVCKLRILK